jgi:23S rRNA (uracil1939-C5)-methyltransferase
MAEIFELTIEKLVNGGAGLGRHDGQAVFVPLTAPGDQVRAQVSKPGKGFLEAELVEIMVPGPGRRPAPCPHYGVCGGCDLQHLEDGAQNEARRGILLDCFRRLGGIDLEGRIEAASAQAPTFGHRNRIRLTAHPTGHYGLKQRGTHDVVPMTSCAVMAPLFDETILPFLRQLPPMDQIVVRLDGRGGWLLSLFGQPARLKLLKRLLNEAAVADGMPAGLAGILLNNLPAWGRDYLVVHVAGHNYRVGHQSFFQGNLAAAEDAVATARTWLTESRPEPGPLADLYAGAGLFTLALADLATRVLAVETAESAFHDLQNNVHRAAATRDRTTTRRLPVEAALADPGLRAEFPWTEAVVVLDPPRTGLGKPVLGALAELRPAHLIYLSCDPATLARDCAALLKSGFRLDRVRELTMFPQTANLETLVLLTRADDA